MLDVREGSAQLIPVRWVSASFQEGLPPTEEADGGQNRGRAMAQACLDQQLIASARRITTGANIHRVKELIFVYEQAVSLHNCGWPSHRIYQREHEIALRRFVAKELQLRFSSSNEAD
jgi:hypothetical protein